MARVLIVDDESNMRRVLSVILEEDGHAVVEASGVSEARQRLAAAPVDLVLTDQKMPDGDGLAVIALCGESDPAPPVIMMTAFASIELAVQAMRRGAFDFISKPFMPEVVRAAVARAVDRAELERENERLRGEVRRLGGPSEIVGRSAAMAAVRDTIARVAPTPATVLITGETGTGKELVARAIHEASPRANGPFVAVNCAAFTETLLESELFGHERGAFTSADRSRQGLFEAAHRGTLFLDEGGEMSLPLQARLLRVLTDGQIVRVGSTAPRPVDVRPLVATHHDLPQRVREGSFREDLYYRLAVVPLPIAPLRERPEDVPLLVEHFLKQVALDLKLPARSITPAAMRRLERYPFPGNVRELRNLIERASILARGAALDVEDFRAVIESAEGNVPGAATPAEWVKRLPGSLDLRRVLEEFEREAVRRALLAANGIQAEAARNLGLSRSDMAYRIRKFGLDRPDA
jgi:DNA-binding NtrC family response regulator